MKLTAPQQQMVSDNLGLIAFTMHRVCRIMPDHSRYDDLWQDGVLGLCRAVQKFDPDKAKFSTYAVHWIRQAVQRGVGEGEGINYRHAHAKGADYLRPISLDQPATQDGDSSRTIGDLIVDPCNVEAVAVERVTGDTTVTVLRQVSENPLVEAIIAASYAYPGMSAHQRDRVIGPSFKISAETVRRHRQRAAQEVRAAVS